MIPPTLYTSPSLCIIPYYNNLVLPAFLQTAFVLLCILCPFDVGTWRFKHSSLVTLYTTHCLVGAVVPSGVNVRCVAGGRHFGCPWLCSTIAVCDVLLVGVPVPCIPVQHLLCLPPTLQTTPTTRAVCCGGAGLHPTHTSRRATPTHFIALPPLPGAFWVLITDAVFLQFSNPLLPQPGALTTLTGVWPPCFYNPGGCMP